MTGTATRDSATRTDDLARQLLLEKYEPIAIIGMGLRFPGDNDTPEAFARFLRSGGDASGPVPVDRWDMTPLQESERAAGGAPLAAGGCFVSGMDEFDPRFFNISPKEAGYVDPQHRWALECAWRALESANIDPGTLRDGNGGVYLGVGQMDFAVEVESIPDADLDAHVAAGTAHSAAAGRLSYFLGWRGPCLAVDTACSSSLVALHLAVQGLRRGECDIALAGGVNATHHKRNHIVYSRAGMLSPDGRCKTFDDSADGYGRSEGCGMFVLKRLSAARRDGDTVLALVRGSAVRQDGESGGLTVPNGTAQAALMRAALDSANLRPDAIDYVEAHGTGTSLGDPIEMGAIDSVFSASRADGGPLPVGSVKTNIGHMEAAAGAGGVVKAVLQLRDRVLYPHLHLRNPSRHIPWDRYRVTVPTECVPWDKDGPRRVLVNSFGFAGTIASVVLEEPPAHAKPTTAEATDDGTAVFTLSAKSQAALPAQLRRYRQHLDEDLDVSIADLCRTSNLGRAHLPARVAWPVADRAELVRLLDESLAAPASAPPAGARPRAADICFLFTGQGSQYVGMGRALYDRYPVFRADVDRWDRLFAGYLDVSIRDVMFGLADAPAADLDQTLYTQPALFTLEHALAELWMSWNVRPTVLLGHSIGEIVAATVAGLFSAEDAARLVATRARLMQSVAAPGGMVVVRAAAEDLAPLVDKYGDLGFGGFNAPEQTVISGGRESLAAVVAELTARGIGTTALPVSHAFHSPLMAEVFDDFRDALKGMSFREPRLSFVSNLTGGLARFSEVSTPEYWVRHIAEPVDFLAGMRHVQSRGPHVFVEVGPSAVLTGMGRQFGDPAAHVWISSLERSGPGTERIRRALATCYTAGLPVDWAGYHEGRPGRRVRLPGYEFDKKRYWLPAHRGAPAASRTAYEHPLLGRELSSDAQRNAGEREFRAHLGPTSPAYLADHVVMGQTVFPGAGYVEILFAVQDAVFGETARQLRDLRILEPLFLPEDTDTEVRTRIRATGDGDHSVEIVSRVDGRAGAIERLHATGTITGPAVGPAAGIAAADRLLAVADTRSPESRHRPEDLYARYADLGLPYGPQFRRMLTVVSHGPELAVGTLRGIDTATIEHLPAFLLDCAMQTVGAVVDLEDAYLPVAFDTVDLLKKPKGELRTVVEVTAHDADGMTVDLAGFEGSRPVFVASGIRFKRVASPAGEGVDRLFLEPRWLKRSLIDRKAGRERRQIVVVGRPEADFAAVAPLFAEAGVTVHRAGAAASVASLVAEASVPTDVCWFWRGGSGEGIDRLRGEAEENYRDLLALVSHLDGQRDVRLVLVTEGAQWLPGDPPRPADQLAGASLWGAGRVLLTEYPALRPLLVDLPAPDGPADLRPLADELLAADPGSGEFQVAYRAGVRHVKRLAPPKPAGTQPDFELRVTEYGRFDAIKPVPAPDADPVGDEVSIAVHAAGLNFKDVLNALGMLRQYAQEKGLPQTDLPLGFEGAGTVVAAGPDASFRPGDEVMFSRLGCMRSRVTVPSSVVVAKPDTVDFARAAAIPAAYVTAYHALHNLAGIKAGDRVLIHAAAGGVGQAAVRLAQQAGAEVFATASPRKWALLHSQGIRHVMNSRTPAFADDVLAATDGRGVDIVLNSLSGEYIPEGVRALAEGGRFVELGKIGVWSPEQMAAERPDAIYHNFDLSELPERELDRLTGEALRTVSTLLAEGRIEPPPTVVYGLDEVEEAFSVLSRGANVGKLVVRLREDDAPAVPVPVITADKTYLVTGGLGALGRVTARVLVGQGARRIMLVGRRRPDEADLAALAADLGADVDLTAHACDITDADDVARLMAEADRPDAPLGGVIHAAGVLADAPFERQTWESIETVLAAKMYGGWLLHQAVAQRPDVEFFVAYSSISSVLGAAGQVNYAAANTYLDVLMHHRLAAGMPGLSLNWGPWAEVGMAAGLSAQHVESIEARGIRYLSPADASRALVRALRRPWAQTVVGEFDWAAYGAGRPDTDALFAHLAPRGGEQASVVDVDTLLSVAPAERQAALLDALRARVAQVLRFDSPGDIEPDSRFVELGLDSLAAVELKNALESAFRVPLPTSALFDHPTVRAFAGFLDGLLAPRASDPEAGDEPDADTTIHDLTDDEADAELAALRDLTG